MKGARVVHLKERPGNFFTCPVKMFQYGELEHTLRDPAYMVEIDGRSHHCAGDKQRFCGIHPVFINNCPLTGPDQVPYKTLGINRSIGGTCVIGIPEKVIHPVHVQVAMNDPGKGVLSFYHSAELTGINSLREEHLACLFLHHHFNIIVRTAQVFLHERFACMREWPMPDVMKKSRGEHQWVLSF